MKTPAQKAACARRKAHRKSLLEAGRQSTNLVSFAERQAIEAAGRSAQLEGELYKARQELGTITTELGEARQAKALAETVLDGLRGELAAASETVASLEAERDELSGKLAATSKELDAIKEVDVDTRSLRTRLQRKSEEIEELKRKLQESEDARRAAKHGISYDVAKAIP
jgi:chromosome segregation ATPase